MFVAVESRVDPATGMTMHTDDIRKIVDPVLAKFDHRI
jgi:6-pyruvoyl-tetrahydropterin synthase